MQQQRWRLHGWAYVPTQQRGPLLLTITCLPFILFFTLPFLSSLPNYRELYSSFSPAAFHISPTLPACYPAYHSTQLLSCCPWQPVKLHLGCRGDSKAHHHRDLFCALHLGAVELANTMFKWFGFIYASCTPNSSDTCEMCAINVKRKEEA